MNDIRVMIIDDSPTMRAILTQCINGTPGFEVVASAHSALDAFDKLKTVRPDVITLDVEMPQMDGLAFLEQLMKTQPLPVVMVSAVTQSGAQATLRALQLGAVDFVGKPSGANHGSNIEWLDEVRMKVRRAAQIRPAPMYDIANPPCSPLPPDSTIAIRARKCRAKVIILAGGTGATTSLFTLLRSLPPDCPPVVAALQLSRIAADVLVSRAAHDCFVYVKPIPEGRPLMRGQIYLCAGDSHVAVAQVGGQCIGKLVVGEPRNGSRPCIDALFESAAKQFGRDAIAVLLDAACDDGQLGIKLLCEAGARVIRETRELVHKDFANEVDNERWQAKVTPSIISAPIGNIQELLFSTA